MSKHFYDIVIVGNGVIGYSLALQCYLINRKLNIAVIGKRARDNSATPAAGAMLGCFSEITKATFSNPYGKLKFEISLNARKNWKSWLEQINSFLEPNKKLTISSGTFLLLNAESGQLDSDNFEAITTAANTYQEKYECVDNSLIPGIKPSQIARPLKTIYFPDEGCIEPAILLDRFEAIFSQFKTITLIDDCVTKVNSNSTGILSLQTSQGEIIEGQNYALCAGFGSQAFINQIPILKERIPTILAGSGYAMQFKNDIQLQNVVRTPNRSFSCGLHAVPQITSDTIYIGATNVVSADPYHLPRIGDMQLLINSALGQINHKLYKSEVKMQWVGIRPVTLDTFPLVGQTSFSNLWILTGTYRDGILMSPEFTFHLAANMLLNEKSKYPEFLPERVPYKIFTKKEAVSYAVQQLMASGYELGMKLPEKGWDSFISSMMTHALITLYDSIDYPLNPDLLNLFFDDNELWSWILENNPEGFLSKIQAMRPNDLILHLLKQCKIQN